MGLYGGMKMNKKSLVFIMSLMCLIIGCGINATIVNAKANPNIIERKTDDITVGKYEITLGKYDSSAKVGRPIFVKGKNTVKKKIGYARGGVYYTYNKSIVYVDKANILCKTNIVTKKTKKIMKCKEYTIADSF